ncbi:hypothetical protein BDR07DRAFT_1382925 [Suillus spraguei]|nr:hypothetical protein BDR07DRAFT_1382925 [Suillus spraguei]
MAATPGNPKIFVPYLEDIDEAAIKCFQSYDGALGTSNSNYRITLHHYQEMKWLDTVLARIMVWLTPVMQEHMQMPLVTGMVLDKVWTELTSVKEGYKEISRWFEPLLDTMKINVGNTHAVDDGTEALFCSIERVRGVHKEHALQEVWSVLWEGRTSAVLQLHNKMSTASMEETMKQRATTKSAFQTRWKQEPEATKSDSTALYDVMKKYMGEGIIDMPASMMSKTGMRGMMATAWDWKRKAIKKQARREAIPSIQGILMEMNFAATYRPKVLDDPLIWDLRAKLENIINTHHIGSKLRTATAGSLASTKWWTYWDDTQKQQIEILHRTAAEKADKDAILKVIKSILAMPMSRLTPDKKSPVSSEVAEAINQLKQVLSLGASRMRIRTSTGIDEHKFDPEVHHVDLHIPDIEGEIDMHTVRRSKPSIIMGQQDEEAEDNRNHGRGKDKAVNRDDEHEDNDKGSSSPLCRTQAMSGTTSKGKGCAPTVCNNVRRMNKVKVTDVDEEEGQGATDMSPEDTIKSKPRPRPIERKKGKAVQSNDDLITSFSADEEVPGLDGTSCWMYKLDDDIQISETQRPRCIQKAAHETVLSMEEKLRDTHITDISPLTSSIKLKNKEKCQNVGAPGYQDVQLVKDYELANEVEAFYAGRRTGSAASSRIPPKPPRHHAGTEHAHGHRTPSEGASASKRDRNDAFLISPDNKKKHKRSQMRTGFVDEDDDELLVVDIMPDM